jgi:outer membrane protein
MTHAPGSRFDFRIDVFLNGRPTTNAGASISLGGNYMRTKTILIVVIAMLALPAAADAGDWILRLRGINIAPNDSSDPIGDFGGEVTVDSKTTVEVDVTYMFSPNFGVELIAATARHDLGVAGGDLDGADVGSVKVLPPTATLQWHPINEGLLDFYLGVGLNYTYFYSYDLSDDLAALGVTDIDFSSSFGLAGNVGLSVYLGENFHLNGDVKYIQITTDADLKVGSDTLLTVGTDINPWVYGIGVGYKF